VRRVRKRTERSGEQGHREYREFPAYPSSSLWVSHCWPRRSPVAPLLGAPSGGSHSLLLLLYSDNHHSLYRVSITLYERFSSRREYMSGRENKSGAVWGPLTLKSIYQEEIASFHFSTTRFVRETTSLIGRAIHVGIDLTFCHHLNVSVY